MKHPLTDILNVAFNTAAPKPKKQRKRASPISIRVSDDERAQLQALAGRKPLGTYIKDCLFKGQKPRKTPERRPVDDFEALAKVLSALGRSDLFRNLDMLVAQAEAGTLDLTDAHVQTVLTACACVTSMRADLIQALGLKAD